MTTASEIHEWFEEGKKRGATHVLVVCDTFSYEDYPIYILPGMDIKATMAKYNGPNMQKIHEVLTIKDDDLT